MQILTVSPDRYVGSQNHLKQMHRLRADVFGGRLEWDVTIMDAGERDQYDDLNPTYILATSGGHKVVCFPLSARPCWIGPSHSF